MVGPSNIRAMLHTVHILGVKRQWGGGRAVVRPCIDHAVKAGAKPRKYLPVPPDQVTDDKRLKDYLSFQVATNQIVKRHPQVPFMNQTALQPKQYLRQQLLT
jgi:hypothetical protein